MLKIALKWKARVAIAALLIPTIYYAYHHIRNEKHSRILVNFDEFKNPIIDVCLEGKRYPFVFDLGKKCLLSMSTEDVKILTKNQDNKVYIQDINGDHYEFSSYKLPKAKIASLILKNPIIQEKGGARTIGRHLLEISNLLLDFPNSTIIACNSQNKLKKLGYHLGDMIKVPIEINRAGILFNAETDFGEKKFLLSTSSISIIRKSLVKHENNEPTQHFESSKFIINGKDIGRMHFYTFEITPELSEIDGICGKDILNAHIVYIDYINKLLYISEREKI